MPLLLGSAGLSVYAMHDREALDWFMPLGFYLCLAAFLRGYFFQYYHGGRWARALVLAVLIAVLLLSALLWEDRSQSYRLRAGDHFVRVEGELPFHWAALFHGLMACTLFIHTLLPRRWLVRATEEVVEVVHPDREPTPPPPQFPAA